MAKIPVFMASVRPLGTTDSKTTLAGRRTAGPLITQLYQASAEDSAFSPLGVLVLRPGKEDALRVPLVLGVLAILTAGVTAIN